MNFDTIYYMVSGIIFVLCIIFFIKDITKETSNNTFNLAEFTCSILLISFGWPLYGIFILFGLLEYLIVGFFYWLSLLFNRN